MSENLDAIILGIIQGLTEFLPVSSSGHLELAKFFLGEQFSGEESLFLTIVLHMGTVLSTLIVFRKEIAELSGQWLTLQWNDSNRYSALLALSMVPAVLVGLLWEKPIEGFFSGQVLLVCGSLIFTSLILIIASRARETGKSIGWKEALLIGIAQAIAILPGVSRSGMTISAAVLLGLPKSETTKFSFLMVLPIIVGKFAKDILDGNLGNTHIEPLSLVLGFLASFVFGWIACRWMIAIVRKSQLHWFALYCAVVGISVMIWYSYR